MENPELIGSWRTECTRCKRKLLFHYRRHHVNGELCQIIEEILCQRCNIPWGAARMTCVVKKRAG